LKKEFPTLNVYGNSKGEPKSGAFEVTTQTNELLWSKLKDKKRKPNKDDIRDIVRIVGSKFEK
jgi:selT/selW/selH-like putative selenoprotein